MKKLLVIILIIASAFCSTLCSGCNKEKPQEKEDKVVLADFEQWGPDFQIMRPKSYFGIVNVNTDKKYVKSGNRSAKIQPMGNLTNGAMATLVMPLWSELFNFEYTDFRYVESLSFWFYNTREETIKMEVGLSMSSLSKFAEYSFKPGWTKAVIYPDYELLSFSIDLSYIEGIYFSFENSGSNYEEDLPVYYMDDVELKLMEAPVETAAFELNENEIIGFEKDYQKYVVSVDKSVTTEYYNPAISVVNAADYGITATEGEKVLRVQTYHAEKPGDYQWPRICIGASYMKNALKGIPTEEWADYEILYDAYCENGAEGIYNEFFSSDGVKAEVTAELIGERIKEEWYTVKIPLSCFVGKDAQRNPGAYYWRWYSYAGEINYTYYIDNFRYQKVSK